MALRPLRPELRPPNEFALDFNQVGHPKQLEEAVVAAVVLFGHPDKTQLVPFQRPSQRPSARDDATSSGSFDLLGFTHYWGQSRRGNWVIKRKTSTSRFRRAVRKIADWCRWNRHLPVEEQHRKLSQKLRGHDAYFGITGNSRMLQNLRHVVAAVWRKWLARRRARSLSWERLYRVLEQFPLPNARVVHSVYALP
jgi:hypothetical protein